MNFFKFKDFQGSRQYWEDRYRKGGTSGKGSFGNYAKIKSEFVNGFIKKHKIKSAIDFGCGDGEQLSSLEIPKYVGIDVESAVEKCREKFKDDKTKRFFICGHCNQIAELALSMDVLMHLIEDVVFEDYMRQLFASATRFIIIHAPNTEKNPILLQSHERYRKFTDWVDANAKEWSLIQTAEGTVLGTYFFVYEKNNKI